MQLHIKNKNENYLLTQLLHLLHCSPRLTKATIQILLPQQQNSWHVVNISICLFDLQQPLKFAKHFSLARANGAQLHLLALGFRRCVDFYSLTYL